MITTLCNIVYFYTRTILWQVALGQVSIGYGRMVAIHNSRIGSLDVLSVDTFISQVGAHAYGFFLALAMEEACMMALVQC
jgi:hypothetical protein